MRILGDGYEDGNSEMRLEPRHPERQGQDPGAEFRRREAAMRLLEGTLDLLFPPKCPFCGRLMEQAGICAVCRQELPWIEDADSLREGADGLRCAGALWYEGSAAEGLRRLKFQGASAAAEPMGALVAQCAARWFSGEFDTVTWVPVSRKRLRQRGYDQAELLARAACRHWETVPVRLLNKTQDNPAQSGLQEAAARRANVLGVYEPAGEIAGKRVLLVDDICTTGATLSECARVLKDAGAASVVCAAVALTRKHGASEKVHK